MFGAKKFTSVAPVVDKPVAGTAFDQAAAAMAAESAQLMIEAERSAARQAARASAEPLVVLSRELFSLSNQLQQSVDLTVQLMVLMELRKQTDQLSPTKGLFPSPSF